MPPVSSVTRAPRSISVRLKNWGNTHPEGITTRICAYFAGT